MLEDIRIGRKKLELIIRDSSSNLFPEADVAEKLAKTDTLKGASCNEIRSNMMIRCETIESLLKE